MKLRSLVLLLIASSFVLSGCATSTRPTSQNSVIPVSGSSILDSTYMTPNSDKIKLTVIRDSGIAGMACAVRFYLDGVATVDLDSSEGVTLYPKQGEHILSAQWSKACPDNQLVETSLKLEKNDQKKFRISYGVYSGLKIMPTAF